VSITDAEREFYESVLEDMDGASLSDLRYAYFLAALDGTLPSSNKAGLNTLGVAEAVYIENGGTVPAGTPAYTLVIEVP